MNNNNFYINYKRCLILQGMVHVSTAYSHCLRDEIKEEYYPISIDAEELKNIDESTKK